MVIVLLACILTVMLLGVEGFVEAIAGLLMVGFWLVVVGGIALVVLWHM
jgi:hypothetical protein